jgi:hypothetical protein
MPVMDYLVVAVDGRLEDANHPRKGLDGHFHAGTEPSWGGQKHTFDRHAPRLSTSSLKA